MILIDPREPRLPRWARELLDALRAALEREGIDWRETASLRGNAKRRARRDWSLPDE